MLFLCIGSPVRQIAQHKSADSSEEAAAKAIQKSADSGCRLRVRRGLNHMSDQLVEKSR